MDVTVCSRILDEDAKNVVVYFSGAMVANEDVDAKGLGAGLD